MNTALLSDNIYRNRISFCNNIVLAMDLPETGYVLSYQYRSTYLDASISI